MKEEVFSLVILKEKIIMIIRAVDNVDKVTTYISYKLSKQEKSPYSR
jgi:hypothetical protein